MIRVHDPSGGRLAALDRQVESSDDKVQSWALPIDQPTILREKVFITAQQKTLPFHGGCSVMSVTHSSFGARRWDLRWTRSSAESFFSICTRRDRWFHRRSVSLPADNQIK